MERCGGHWGEEDGVVHSRGPVGALAGRWRGVGSGVVQSEMIAPLIASLGCTQRWIWGGAIRDDCTPDCISEVHSAMDLGWCNQVQSESGVLATCLERYPPFHASIAAKPVKVDPPPPTTSAFVMSTTPPESPIDAIAPTLM